jgi:hypothetical protein
VHVCEGVIMETWAQGMAEGVGKSVLHVGFRRKAVGHWVSKVRSSDRLDNSKLWRECANACARPRTIQMKFRLCFGRYAVFFLSPSHPEILRNVVTRRISAKSVRRSCSELLRDGLGSFSELRATRLELIPCPVIR